MSSRLAGIAEGAYHSDALGDPKIVVVESRPTRKPGSCIWTNLDQVAREVESVSRNG